MPTRSRDSKTAPASAESRTLSLLCVPPPPATPWLAPRPGELLPSAPPPSIPPPPATLFWRPGAGAPKPSVSPTAFGAPMQLAFAVALGQPDDQLVMPGCEDDRADPRRIYRPSTDRPAETGGQKDGA